MSDNSIWIVVEVRSGIPVAIKAFSSYKSADVYLEIVRKSLNLDNDETGIFQVDLESNLESTALL
jgi:hypothetical protein